MLHGCRHRLMVALKQSGAAALPLTGAAPPHIPPPCAPRPARESHRLPFYSDNHGADQGLTLAHFKAQLEDLRDTSLTSQLNLSTFGTHPRVKLGYMGDRASFS